MRKMIKQNFSWLHKFFQRKIEFKYLIFLIIVLLFATPFLNLTNRYLVNLLNPEINEASLVKTDFNIKDIITQVRSELLEAELERRKQGISDLFTIKDFDIEIQFVVNANTSQKAGSSLELLVIDSESGYSKERVQKIKLHMVAEPPPPKKIPPTKGLSSKEGRFKNYKSVGEPKEEIK